MAEIWEENNTWCASVPSLPGCHTCADDLPQLEMNIKDAVTGWLDVMNSLESDRQVIELEI